MSYHTDSSPFLSPLHGAGCTTEEWREDARTDNQKHAYTRAIQSLKKYPLPLSSGREAQVILSFLFLSHMCANVVRVHISMFRVDARTVQDSWPLTC